MLLTPAAVSLFDYVNLTDRIKIGHPLPISTSTYCNFETLSSGIGRLVAILGPPIPKHGGGPTHL